MMHDPINTDVANGERTLFEIPEANWAKFEAAIQKLSKRAEKVTGQAIVPIPFGSSFKKLNDGTEMKVIEVYLEADAPKLDGWQFVARLDHSQETGTILRRVPNVSCDIPVSYRNAEPSCDHCNMIRKRRDTFLLCHEDGTFKQVGATCLQDFLGIDPIRVAKMAEYLGYAAECARGYNEVDGLVDRRYIDIEGYLAHVATMIRIFGFVSSKVARENGSESTASMALTNYLTLPKYRAPITDEDDALAQEALEWIRSQCASETSSDYIHNLCVIAGSEMIELRSCPLAASLIQTFLREKGRIAERAKMANSEWVGEVGKRMDFSVKVVSSTSRETDWGYSYIYRFVTDEGNVLVTFSSRSLNLFEGDQVKIRGTVKKHDAYKGVNNTVLTRVVKMMD